jgi:hypothetical protein
LLAEHEQEGTKQINRKDAFGIWNDQIWMADDFDAPLDDLKAYM